MKETTSYACCINATCEMVQQCQRAQRMKQLTEEEKTVTIINPMLVTGDAHCPHLLVQQTIVYAYGMMRLMDELSTKVKREVTRELILLFGKNPYYEKRNGKRPISPEEQTQIRTILQQHGYQGAEIFDRVEG